MAHAAIREFLIKDYCSIRIVLLTLDSDEGNPLGFSIDGDCTLWEENSMHLLCNVKLVHFILARFSDSIFACFPLHLFECFMMC